MKLGIAAEGVTDQQTIENILIGYFKGKDYHISSDEVYQAQPSGDATDHTNTAGYGNWTNLLAYLSGDKIKEDIGAFDYLILQVDSDICDKDPFNVFITQNGGGNKPVATLVSEIVDRLIQEMNSIDALFFDTHKDKIIFAVSVSSIECWIYKHFESDVKKSGASNIQGCENSLNRIVNKSHQKFAKYLGKKSGNYVELTKDLRKPKNLKSIITKDISFDIFYNNLNIIPIPIEEDEDDF